MIACMDTLTRVADSTGRPDQRFRPELRRTVSFRAKPSFVEQVDRAAARKGMDRTAYIEQAVRFFMSVDTSLTHSSDGGPTNGSTS